MDEKDRLIDKLLKNGGELPAGREDLEEELAFRKSVVHALGAARRASIKEDLQQLENSIEEEKKPVVSGRWRYYAAAAILLGVLGGTVWWSQNNLTADEGLSAFLEPYPNVVTAPYVRGEQEENRDALKKAMHTYERGEYANSIEHLKALPSSDTTQFYMAVANLQLPGQDAVAREIFTRLSKDSTAAFYWQGMYYLAVMELMDKKTVPARKRLEQLKKQNAYPYLSRRAEDLLLKRY